MDPLVVQPQPQPLLHPPHPIALDGQPDPPKPTVTRNARACTVCRAVKMKCVGAEDGQQPCQRCKRSNLQCVFEKHRRGRKPGSKLSEASRLLRRIDKAPDDQGGPDGGGQLLGFHDQTIVFRPELFGDARMDSSAGPLPGIHHLASPPSYAPARLSPSRHIFREHDPGRGPDPTPAHSRNNYLGTILNPQPPIDHAPDGQHYARPQPQLQPQPHATRLLDTPPPLAYGGPPAPSATHSAIVPPPPLPPRFPVPAFADPVSAGVLSEADALNLLELIFKNLNPFLMLFDPNLHTMHYIRERSPFLFTCVLTAACKFWRPESHKACLDLTHALIPLAFEKKWRSVEVVQAFLFLTFYPEPHDDRSWSYIGYACRMAVELGMHRMGGGASSASTAERRNCERTYLILFIQDRTLAMLSGKQTMLPDSDLTRAASVWYTDPSVPGGPSVDDVMVCAIVELRRIVMETYELCKSRAMADHNDVDLDLVINSCNNKLSDWMELWHTALQRAGGQMFHFSVLCLYRLQTRLYLNGLGLDAALTSRDGVQTISRCYTSGLSALLIVAKELAPIRLLHFTHHLVTLMTAYCAVFLLRLLPISAVFTELTEMYDKTLDMVQQTAAAYEDVDGGDHDAARFFRALLVSDVTPQSKDDDVQTAVDSAGPASANGTEKRTPTASASRTPSPHPVLRPLPSAVRMKHYPAFEFPAGPAVPTFPFRGAQPPDGALAESGSDPQDAAQMAEVFWQKTFAQLGFGRVEPIPEQL